MKKLLLSLALAVSLLLPVAATVPAYAAAGDPFDSSNSKGQACAGISGTQNAGACNTPSKSLETIIKNILNFLSAIIGIVAVIMVMVAGFKYITAGGDSGNVSSAKSTLTYAIVGLIIVAMAQFITQFVLRRVIK